jgi:hypothetical protein
MGINASFFVARDGVAHQIVSNPRLFEPDCVDYMRITIAELSTLWAVLQGVDGDTDLMDEFDVVFEEDEGECVIQRLPAGMVAALADLSSDQIESIARKWGDADDIEPHETAPGIVGDLVRLARRALETRQNVYLFNLV